MTVYTAIFGQVDELKEPFVVTEGWNYICYTDQDFVSNVWDVRKVPLMQWGPQKTARWYKINFHKCIDDPFSLWVDGTFFINCNLDQWWEDRFHRPFTTIEHPFDDCIYKDAQSCVELGKANHSEIERQTDLYKHLGIKKHSGLISSGILMRENTMQVKKLCSTWWQQVEQWTSRDQIAFGYAQHKHPGVHKSVKWNYTKETEFIHVPHLTKPWRSARMREVVEKYGSN